MQSSKKNTYVFRDIVGGRGFEPSDSFRHIMGKYWFAGKSLNYGDTARIEKFSTSQKMSVSYGPVVTRILADPPFTSKEQAVYLVGDESFWGAEQVPGSLSGDWNLWTESIKSMVPVQARAPFKDIAFRIDTPFNQKERRDFGDVSGLGFVDVNFNYNYFISSYETAINSILEQVLPNLYSFINGDVSRNLYYLKTLRGIIADKQAEIRERAAAEVSAVSSDIVDSSNLYFALVARGYEVAKADWLNNFSQRFKNYIVPFENLEAINNLTLQNSFPMFVEVSFSTDSVTEVAQILEDASLSTSLQKQVAAGYGSANATLFRRMGGYLESYFVSKQNMDYSPNSSGLPTTSRGRYKSLDLLTWWQRYLAGVVPKVFKNQTIVGPNAYSVYISSGAQNNNLAQALSLLIFSGKLKTILQNKNRSFQQVVDGTSCHSETILYRVSKFKGTSEGQEPIQSYWFPNSNNIDVINLIDTQVKYNSVYTYEVYAYQLAIGTEYEYGPLRFEPPQENTEVMTTCPDIEFPTLNGISCLGAGGIDPQCAQIDYNNIVTTLETLGTNTTDMAALAQDLVTIYIFSGSLNALLPENAIYATYICKLIATKYKHDPSEFQSYVTTAIANYSSGAVVDVSYPADTQATTTYSDFKYIAQTKVTTRPSAKLVEVPFFSHTGIMIDSPPLPPDVNIIPYRGKKDQVLIWLNSTVGEQDMHPISIYKSDAERVSQIRQNKFLSPSDPIPFRSDDPASAFEILRLSVKPENYPDFANNQRAYLTTILESGTFKRASSVSYIDTVNPNTKYYYTFRAVDVHGNTSNPTQVFEIEMVENDGAVFMITNIIDLLDIAPPYDPVKVAKRHVHIVPRITQGLFNKAKSGLESADSALEKRRYALGVEDESIWGKKFKVRFISKSTGRKIDLNLTYGREHVKTPEETHLRQVASTQETENTGWEYSYNPNTDFSSGNIN
tara:strand:+ start:7201 stop:10068 length:2868 start_codon:yes stop_codon:yes gene_type:complete